jgi:2-polyprenyl-3-methyl-5-hydroxy-6-metoxy-1,4-benzoquinol methylase
MTENLTTDKRVCEVCGKEIPLDFVNPLCWECYDKLEKAAGKANEPVSNHEDDFAKVDTVNPTETKNGITEPTYIENPQAEDKEQWEANVALFKRQGKMLWGPTRSIYNFIRDYNLNKITQHPQYPKFIWKPKIVDVGSGCGVGSNVLSQEADFVWGIDKNVNSVRFAKECFTRVKNQIYYSSQVTFDVIDIMTDTRQFAYFDQVVAIEIIEHIDDYKEFLKALTRFDKKDKKGNVVTQDPTEYWISTPNRNNAGISNNRPKNKYHVREWTSFEMYDILSEYFTNIVMHNSNGIEIPRDEYKTTNHTPILFRCSGTRV